MPQLPAMIEQLVFNSIGAISLFPIATVLVDRWNQFVSLFIIIYLGGFQFDFIHANFFCQPVYFGDLVFIGFDDQKLKYDEGWVNSVRFSI